MPRLAFQFVVVMGTLAGALAAQSIQAGEHTKKGVEYARIGDWKSAEAELREAVALAPNDPQVLASLGGVLAMEQKLAEAGSYLERALRLAPDDAVIRRNLARDQWQMGKLPEARRNLERVLKLHPSDDQAVFLLGMVSENSGEYPAAAKLLESVPSLLRSEPLGAAALANSYYHTGRIEQARACLQSIGIQERNPNAIFVAAGVAADARDFELAERMFSSIRSTYVDRATLDFQLALAQYHQTHFADCQITLTEIIATGKASGDVYNLLGWCFQNQGRTKEAITELEQAIALESSKEANYLDIARMLLADGKLGAALEIAGRAVQLFPASDKAWLVKGSIQTGLQSFTDAVKSYTAAVELNQNQAEPRRALATAQWMAGLTAEAQLTFQDLLRRFPQDAANYAAYGALLVADDPSNEETVARGARLLETALSLDPSLAEPHYYLGNFALTKGDAGAAVRHLEAAVKLNPASGKMHFALSKALQRQGRGEESARELRAYQELKAAEDRLWKPR